MRFEASGEACLPCLPTHLEGKGLAVRRFEQCGEGQIRLTRGGWSCADGIRLRGECEVARERKRVIRDGDNGRMDGAGDRLSGWVPQGSVLRGKRRDGDVSE